MPWYCLLKKAICRIISQDKAENKVSVDQWNWVKTNSLIAWVKRTDKKNASPVINITYNYGAFYICGISRNIQTFYKEEIEKEGCFINDVFHKLLHDCADKERSYFLEHDEYSILKEKFRNRGFLDTFGVKIWDYSTGEMTIADENDNERPITMEEIKELVQKCEQVHALIEELTQKTNIVY